MATLDNHTNLAYSTLANAPGTAGTSFILQSGDGAKMPAAPFTAIAWPSGVNATNTGVANTTTEYVRVTGRSTDTLTVTRQYEALTGGVAANVQIGWQLAVPVTAGQLSNIETPLAKLTAFRSLTTSATLATTDNHVMADATGGALTLTLPDATTVTVGIPYHLKKTDTSNNWVYIVPTGSQTIDGNAQVILRWQDTAATVISDGTNWQSTGEYDPTPVSSSGSFYNITPTSLQKWRAAIAKAYNGESFANVVCYGDSITGGFTGAAVAGTSDQANVYTRGYVGRIRALFQQLCGVGGDGINWMFGPAANTSSTTYTDPRIVLSSATEVNQGVFGLNGIQVAGGTQSFTFTPNGPFDTVTVYYGQGTGVGAFTVKIGSQTASTVTPSTTAGAAIGNSTFTATAGYGSYTITITGSGTATIFAIKTTQGSSGVITSQCQLNGRRANDLTQSSVAGNGTSVIGSLAAAFGIGAPDLSIICYGANEYINNVGVGGLSGYKADMQTLITQAKLTGDVLLVTPPPINVAATGYTQYQLNQVLYDLADSNDVAMIDVQKRWVSYSAANAVGMYTSGDNIHPSYRGYYDIATAIYTALTASTGSHMPLRSVPGLPPVTSAMAVPTPQIVSASTTETTLASTIIQANAVAVGTTYSFKVMGMIDNSATATTLTFKLKVGSTALATIAVATPASLQTSKGYHLQGLLTIGTVGSSGAVVAQISLIETTTTTKIWVSPYGSTAINTQAANVISVTGAWTLGTAGNVLRAAVGTIILEKL